MIITHKLSLILSFIFVLILSCAVQDEMDSINNNVRRGIMLGDERCDGFDNDQDGKIDEDFDVDKDDFATCRAGSRARDCDDNNAEINPLAKEICDDNQDNDCDGRVDDGDKDCSAGCKAVTTNCEKTLGVCENVNVKCDDSDNSTIGGNCNYTSHPQYQAIEYSCKDDLDNDCDGFSDELDTDCQQFGTCGASDNSSSLCSPKKDIAGGKGVCAGILMECQNGFWNCNFGIIDKFEFDETTIDGVDNDCDGQTDEGVSNNTGTSNISPDTQGACIYAQNSNGDLCKIVTKKECEEQMLGIFNPGFQSCERGKCEFSGQCYDSLTKEECIYKNLNGTVAWQPGLSCSSNNNTNNTNNSFTPCGLRKCVGNIAVNQIQYCSNGRNYQCVCNDPNANAEPYFKDHSACSTNTSGSSSSAASSSSSNSGSTSSTSGGSTSGGTTTSGSSGNPPAPTKCVYNNNNYNLNTEVCLPGKNLKSKCESNGNWSHDLANKCCDGNGNEKSCTTNTGVCKCNTGSAEVEVGTYVCGTLTQVLRCGGSSSYPCQFENDRTCGTNETCSNGTCISTTPPQPCTCTLDNGSTVNQGFYGCFNNSQHGLCASNATGHCQWEDPITCNYATETCSGGQCVSSACVPSTTVCCVDAQGYCCYSDGNCSF